MTGLCNHRTGAHHGAGDATRGGMTPAEALQETHVNLMVDKWHIKPESLELGFERYSGSPLSAVFWWPEDDKTRSKMRLDGRPYTEADMTVSVGDWYLTIEDTNYPLVSGEGELKVPATGMAPRAELLGEWAMPARSSPTIGSTSPCAIR